MRIKFLLLVFLSLLGFSSLFGQYEKLFEFKQPNDLGSPGLGQPLSKLTFFGEFLYAVSNTGGANNMGAIYAIRSNGFYYFKLLDFSGTANGSNPCGSLTPSNDGVYGMTSRGGANNMGCIYRADASTGYTKLLDFSGAANGSNPMGSLTLSGSVLYGMTMNGGANDKGCIFKINTNGTGYTKLLDFSGTANGSNPQGSLTLSGSVLYGMTTYGGTNNSGCIFKINIDGTGYSKLVDFSGTGIGSNPYGSLTLSSDGALYGMTSGGGANNKGCIFKYYLKEYKLPILGSIKIPTYTKLLSFSGTNGSNPYGSLTLSSDNFLYGMTYYGGENNKGCIFKINTDGTGYTKLLDFSGTANGSYPQGSLTLSESVLYGMTASGGANNIGCMFKINTDGSAYTHLLDFNTSDSYGICPLGSLTRSDNIFYGTTQGGGKTGRGCIYKINSKGTGYAKLFDFSDDTKGVIPIGSLTLSGNVLYGRTQMGGENNRGCIFKIGIDGAGFTKLLDYPNSYDVSNNNGLTISGNVLYGTDEFGGANNKGCIFKINTDGTGYTKLLDFSDNTGSYPQSSLTISGNVLYGTNDYGGANNMGCIFKINTDGTGYTKLLDFSGTANGRFTQGSLTISGNVLYGATSSGGTNNEGCIFEINTDGTGYTKLHDFSDTENGSSPNSPLTLTDGILYGMTKYGGTNDLGCVYQINTDGTGYTKLLDFNGSNGSNVSGARYNGLTIFNNTLYGVTCLGGTSNLGVLFKITSPSLQATNINFPSIDTTQATISWTNGNGNIRAVFVKEGTGLISLPQDSTFYIASNDWYDKGNQLGTSGYYCIYNWPDNTVVLTNLSPGTQYTVQVFEYIGNEGVQHYLTTTAAGNPNTFTTLGDPNALTKSMVYKSAKEENKDGLVEIKTPQNAAFDVTLYPNPNNGIFNINISGKSNIYRVRIMATLGQIVYDQKTIPGMVNINLNNIAKGIYLISVSPVKTDAHNKIYKGTFVIN